MFFLCSLSPLGKLMLIISGEDSFWTGATIVTFQNTLAAILLING